MNHDEHCADCRSVFKCWSRERRGPFGPCLKEAMSRANPGLRIDDGCLDALAIAVREYFDCRRDNHVAAIKGMFNALMDYEAGRSVCPICHAVSHNPNDAANHYCGRCHVFFDDPAEGKVKL
jgi:hypothetical protein